MTAEQSAAVLEFIVDYEAGELESEDDIITGFQLLLDTGMLYQLQGSYQRAALDLLVQGLIK